MRLTKKSDYHFEHYNANTTLPYILNKLGQLEDLMEKYGFETVGDLDGFVQSCINRIDCENKKEK